MKAEREGVEVETYSRTLSLTSALDGLGDHCHTTRPLYYRKGAAVHILQDSGGTLGTVWTGAENDAPKQGSNTESPSP
jgi:hypothetical protein